MLEVREVDLSPDLFNRTMIEFEGLDGYTVAMAGPVGARLTFKKADRFVTGTVDGTQGHDYTWVQILGSGSKMIDGVLMMGAGIVLGPFAGDDQGGAILNLGQVQSTYFSSNPVQGYTLYNVNPTSHNPYLVEFTTFPHLTDTNRVAAAIKVHDSQSPASPVVDSLLVLQHDGLHLISPVGATFSYWIGSNQGGTATVSGLSFSGGLYLSGSLSLAIGDIPNLSSLYLTLAAGAGFQPINSDLTALGGLTGTNTIYYRSAAHTWSAVTIGSNLTFSGGTLAASGGGAGTVTVVDSGSGLTGGPITTTGTLALDLNGLTTAAIADTDTIPFAQASVAGANKKTTAALLAAYIMPSGMVMPFAGGSTPAGWLDCDGSAVSRSTYAGLFTAIGTTWGAGNGTTTFNVPDMRGRAAIGAGTGGGLSSRTLGATGGEESHALTIPEIPAHSHPPLAPNTTFAGNSPIGAGLATPGTALVAQPTTGLTGGGGTHNTMMPFAVLKWIIKT